MSVCIWDLYNEPGNAILPLASGRLTGCSAGPDQNGAAWCAAESDYPAAARHFEWARSVDPMQPITVGLWAPIPRLNRLQTACSDVISFHHYQSATSLRSRIETLKKAHGRPVICTEWMARPVGSRVETISLSFRSRRWAAIAGAWCRGARKRSTVGPIVPVARRQRSGTTIC